MNREDPHCDCLDKARKEAFERMERAREEMNEKLRDLIERVAAIEENLDAERLRTRTKFEKMRASSMNETP